MECPIGLDKIHCQNCMFGEQGYCNYKNIMAHAKVREEVYKKYNRELKRNG